MRMTVTFTSEGRILEASLFLPPHSTAELSPALLFEGTMTGATGPFTEHLAEHLSGEGFVCLVLDHSFYGDDEASPLSWESPGKRVEDIKAGLKFLSQQSTTDENSIVGVGVSVGAEYLARAVEQIGICKAFVIVQGPFDDAQNYIENLDIPTLLVEESDLEGTADEISLWVKTMFGRGGKKWRSGRPLVDWSVSDK